MNTRDRRSYEVALTPIGRSLARRVARAFEQEVRRLVRGLGQGEQELLSALLTGILADDAQERGIELLPAWH